MSAALLSCKGRENPTLNKKLQAKGENDMKEKIKNTWKKIWKPVTIGVGALAAVGIIVAVVANTLYIGVDEAKEIASSYVGATGTVRYTEAKLDWSDKVYDIEFIADGVKYEIEVDADSGQVLKLDYDGKPLTGNNSNTGSGSANTGASSGSTAITEDEAKSIALNHAGVSSSDASFVRAHLDWDDGRQVYEVEFYSGNNEYDYEIDASTGDIISYDYDAEYYTRPSTGNGSASTGSGSANTGASSGGSTTITEDEAKSIALNHAGVSSSDASFVRAHLDWDDGRQVYEVEFYSGNNEYDYEINASTGEIVSYDYDAEYYTRPSTNSGNTGNSSANSGTTGSTTTITEDEAKNIALNHAGVSASDASFVRAHLDWDDGRQVYEVEFYSGNNEYDYEIDASTGDIISYDYDAEHYTRPDTGNGGEETTITADEATSIALNHAGVSQSDTYGLHTELDRDDGRVRYEVEFKSGGYEYNYTINASDGSIVEYDRERD